MCPKVWPSASRTVRSTSAHDRKSIQAIAITISKNRGIGKYGNFTVKDGMTTTCQQSDQVAEDVSDLTLDVEIKTRESGFDPNRPVRRFYYLRSDRPSLGLVSDRRVLRTSASTRELSKSPHKATGSVKNSVRGPAGLNRLMARLLQMFAESGWASPSASRRIASAFS
jgi:hypothetical protein